MKTIRVTEEIHTKPYGEAESSFKCKNVRNVKKTRGGDDKFGEKQEVLLLKNKLHYLKLKK